MQVVNSIATPQDLSSKAAHILIIDDDPTIARSIFDFLSLDKKYKISIAAGGSAAMKQLETSLEASAETIDLILLDVTMPNVSGLDLLRWLRKRSAFNALRIIMLTAVGGKKEIVEALSMGADDYVTKPYHPQELKARIETLLRVQKLEKQLKRQSQQLAILNRISNEITTTIELIELLKASAKGVHELLGMETVGLFMHDTRRNALRCQLIEHWGETQKRLDFPSYIALGEGAISRAFEFTQTVCIYDVSEDSRFVEAVDSPLNYKVESLMATPFFMKGHVVGVIVAFNKKVGAIVETDADLFVTLTGSISKAIENAWLYKREKQQEEKMRQRKEALQAVIDGILHPIYTINKSWRVVTVNKTNLNEHDVTLQKAVGRLCYKAFYGRDKPCGHCKVAQVMQGKETRKWGVRGAGNRWWAKEWDVVGYPIPEAGDDDARVAIVWQDRTEERRMENSLFQAEKLAAIGQLAAGVAHEINNPLTVISASATMLKESVLEDDENYELVEWISNASDRAIKVVGGMLDFARQSGYVFERGDIKTSLKEATHLVAYQMQSAEIFLDLQMEDNLPEVVASWEHLKTVWINLLINAQDALLECEGERRITVQVYLDETDGHILLLFNDNGPGMAEEDLAHIFEPFFSTKDPGKGTGLGLANTHRIIGRHGGEINVSSEQGKGTSFFIRLPVGEKAMVATIPMEIAA